MIGKIEGIVSDVFFDYALIMTNSGLGYEIMLINSDLSSICLGESCSFYIHQIIKEDSVNLYGFSSFEYKCWFEFLIKIDGLGPKTAMNILSQYSLQDIQNAILNNDDNLFIAISGIGKKIASRIVNEMQTSLNKINIKINSISSSQKTISKKLLFDPKEIDSTPKKAVNDESVNGNKDDKIKKQLTEDSILSLVALGFNRAVIYNTISQIISQNPEITDPQDVIKRFFNKKE